MKFRTRLRLWFLHAQCCIWQFTAVRSHKRQEEKKTSPVTSVDFFGGSMLEVMQRERGGGAWGLLLTKLLCNRSYQVSYDVNQIDDFFYAFILHLFV